MGNADLVRCVLGHVLAGINEYNAWALARAATHWTRVGRAHWAACQSANGAWLDLTRRHFGTAITALVPNDARANFYALCRKAQSNHMGLPFFMRFGVTDNDSLAEAILEHDPSVNVSALDEHDWRVRGWRVRYRIMARHVLRLLTWHPHGKYALYDMEGMVAYFLGMGDVGPPGTTEAYPFETHPHKMAAFLYPNLVTNWESFRSGESQSKALNARKYVLAIRKVNLMLERFREECA